MNRIPFGRGACCLPRVEGLTYLEVGSRRATVGMSGLETVFQQLYAMGRRPEEATDAELVGMARQFNYIPNRPTIEADYATALREAYARFHARQEKEHEPATNASPPTAMETADEPSRWQMIHEVARATKEKIEQLQHRP